MLEVASTVDIGNSKTNAESATAATPKITMPSPSLMKRKARCPLAPRTFTRTAMTSDTVLLITAASAIHHTTL
jgi:hypothetical protein